MNALAILYGAAITKHALEPLFDGKNALEYTINRAAAFPNVSKIALFAAENFDEAALPRQIGQNIQIEIVRKARWNTKILLEAIALAAADFDFCYFAWADTPLLDPSLAEAILKRHIDYAAEYSYADGFPAGLAPEILARGTAAILFKLNGEDESPVGRGAIFKVLQKDINSFDIETEISEFDLRAHKLNLACNTKRNTLLARRFFEAGALTCKAVEKTVLEKPEILRTLPRFFPVMVNSDCEFSCAYCPFSRAEYKKNIRAQSGAFMGADKFNTLLDKITRFAEDAVIDISLWGEVALHPEKLALFEAVLARKSLSLIIETSCAGFSGGDIASLATLIAKADADENSERDLARVSCIASLDSADAEVFTKLHGTGFARAQERAKELFSVFKNNFYVQAIRARGGEEDIEKFYRYWKAQGANVIIQKYDDFCGRLPRVRAGDISPLKRLPCSHIMRDMPVLLDGSVPYCRETIVLDGTSHILGNVFSEDLALIWERGDALYKEHCVKNYNGLCKECDEYYTFNF